ncbi:rubredoxin-like domain-containing protein [uncultured Sphaerochaeta sp.]|uniref:rubredoxin-like domain-containing protein n=1 Tax=uncultured Sphaerochaeta sp. TaxID=886478 RepID=UPI002A0A5B21|nr:rubredoxin [uncultured Sphaerochaeta sp.]
MEGPLREISCGELSVVCSNLSKACAKQLRRREELLFAQLSDFYQEKGISSDENYQMQDLLPLILQDLQEYPKAKEQAVLEGDRGSLRALVWGEKVSKLLKTLLARQKKQQDTLLENTNVYVCEVCGFVTVADAPPEICPICKAPRTRFSAIQREVQ